MSITANVFFESETITERPVVIPFSFDNKENIPKEKNPGESIVIKPVTVRTWFRLKPLLLSIKKEDLEKLVARGEEMNAPDNDIISIVSKYDELLMDIVCVGIHNKKSDMPEWFRQALQDNCTWKDIHILFNAIVYRLGFQSFCKSITTAASVSPMTEAEIIAAQKNEESWTNLSALLCSS